MTAPSSTLPVHRDRHPLPGTGRRTAVVSGLPSDAHTWNLVFVQLLLEELDYRVVNLGPCVPADLLVAECLATRPDLVVLGSVNGHGYHDGPRVVAALRACPELADVPIVIGGKLGIAGTNDLAGCADLLAAGCDAVFEDGADAVTGFRHFAYALPERATP